MIWIAAIGGLAFMLASLLVGGRLLVMAWRSRGFPEFTLGLGLFMMGGIATPMVSVAKAPTGLPESTRVALYVAYLLIVAAGVALIGFFTWRVFRPKEAVGRIFGLLLPGASFAAFAAIPLTSSFADALGNRGFGPHAMNAANVAVFAWSAFESFRYSLALSRRARLGLADPIVVDRVRLWGIGITLAASMTAGTGVCAWYGVDVMATTLGAALIGNLGLLAAVCLSLAFMPPESYVAWVRRRAS